MPNDIPAGSSGEQAPSAIANKIPALFQATYRVSIALVAVAIIILLAPLPPLIAALIVLGAAALLALIGAAAFHAFTCAIKAHYANNAAGAAATYGFPTYAALKASWPWLVRVAAC